VRRRMLTAAALAATLSGCAALSGCATTTDVAPSPAASVAPEQIPGSTLPASRVTAEVPEGQTLAVVMAPDADEQERLALTEIETVAAEHGGSVRVFADAVSADAVDGALASAPDVIVSVGPEVTGAVDLASASNLDVRFLILGSQLAEPTGNVIAVVWPGADERAVFAEEEHQLSRAADYALTAIETGLAAFASGLEGHVIRLG